MTGIPDLPNSYTMGQFEQPRRLAEASAQLIAIGAEHAVLIQRTHAIRFYVPGRIRTLAFSRGSSQRASQEICDVVAARMEGALQAMSDAHAALRQAEAAIRDCGQPLDWKFLDWQQERQMYQERKAGGRR